MSNKKKYIIAGVILIAVIIAAIPFMGDIQRLWHVLDDVENVKRIVLSYGSYSFLVFILIQVIQIVVFIIPGEIVQIAGGYIFGPLLAFILCMTGSIIGSLITFSIGRKLGKPFVKKIASEKTHWIINKLESSKHKKNGKENHNKPATIMFILYVIPGLPKDVLGYISGVSDLTLKEFLVISTVGRIPGVFMSCFFGNQISMKNMDVLISFVVIFAIVFAIAFFYSRKHINKLKKDSEE